MERKGIFGTVHNTELARIGARAMLHMLIVDNLVHSDLHPGNILVDFKPRAGCGWFVTSNLSRLLPREWTISYLLTPSVTLLDAGMCTRLSKEDQVNMVGLFDSFSRLDGDDIASWTLRFAGDDQTCKDTDSFKMDVKQSFEILKESSIFEEGNMDNGAEALASLLETVRLHHVSLPGHICATVVTTLVLEGWSHQLDPAHSTLSEVRRIIKMKKGETVAKNIAMWVQSSMFEREILDSFHVPPSIVSKSNKERFRL